MTTFILSQVPPTQAEIALGKEYPRRAILDTEGHGNVLAHISAEPIMRDVVRDGEVVKVVEKSAWRVARERVDEEKFFRIEGEGYFPIDIKSEAFLKSDSDGDQ